MVAISHNQPWLTTRIAALEFPINTSLSLHNTYKVPGAAPSEFSAHLTEEREKRNSPTSVIYQSRITEVSRHHAPQQTPSSVFQNRSTLMPLVSLIQGVERVPQILPQQQQMLRIRRAPIRIRLVTTTKARKSRKCTMRSQGNNPSRAQLVSIVVALAICVFQVSSTQHSLPPPLPESQMILAASKTSPGTTPPSL